MRKLLTLALLWLTAAASQAVDRFVDFLPSEGSLCLFGATIGWAEGEWPAVKMAAGDLLADFEAVCGQRPAFDAKKPTIVIGTLGRNKAIDKIVKKKRLDLRGKREKYIIATYDGRLYIMGSDRRGTVYGIYELSRQMGISPWHYWADVPVARHDNIYIRSGNHTDGEPAVRYRALFLNDEAPCLSGWAGKTFGGFNSKFYRRVFQLVLRLKGNMIWPAMWGSAMYADDPLTGPLADSMGVCIGTSHHEPMSRSQAEWHRTQGDKTWDYNRNKAKLQEFWAGGVRRNKGTDDLVTVGMRGDGDEAMGDGTNIKLMQQIVADQREIIARERECKPEDVPQVWALYKEVQDYYHKGMRVPDDITLLLCDNNWGSLRMLPDPKEPKRGGGYGMYYHFDYVGGPRCYRWLNVSQIQRIWTDMNMAYENGVDRLWIVNVGDLKPMEYPIQFWFDMAWRPQDFNAGNLLDHTAAFCRENFGEEYADDIARLLNLQCKYAHQKTPEQLNLYPFSLENYGEMRRATDDYTALEAQARQLCARLDPKYRDAYQQIVYFPIQAFANLYRMYYAAATGDSIGTQRAFDRDAQLTRFYNDTIAGGKWKHIMDQTHISYTTWASPDKDIMPKIAQPAAAAAAAETSGAAEPSDNKAPKGYVAIEAEHYSAATPAAGLSWNVVPYLGKFRSAIGLMPTNIETAGSSIAFDFTADGDYPSAELHCYWEPMLDYTLGQGIWYEVQIDDQPAVKVDLINMRHEVPEGHFDQNRTIDRTTRLDLNFAKGSRHRLTLRPLSRGMLLQRVAIDFGGMKKAYLGAPETYVRK